VSAFIPENYTPVAETPRFQGSVLAV